MRNFHFLRSFRREIFSERFPESPVSGIVRPGAHPGWIAAEALAALFLLSLLAAGVLPLIIQTGAAMREVSLRGHLAEAVLTSAQYMTEAVRNDRRRKASAGAGDRYVYYDISMYGDDRKYTFLVSGKRFKVQLYNDSIQPLTGNETAADTLDFRKSGSSLFWWDEHGLVQFGFAVDSAESGLTRTGESAVLSYADYYRKGEPYGEKTENETS